MLQIVGLGNGRLKLLTMEVYQVLNNADKLYLQTNSHPIIEDLQEEKIKFEVCDHIYQNNNQAVDLFLESINIKQNIVYAVPGHPLIANDIVRQIIDKLNTQDYKIISAPSFLDSIFTRLNLNLRDGIKILVGDNLNTKDLDPDIPTLITNVYNEKKLIQIKEKLLEIYSKEFEIKILYPLETITEQIDKIEIEKMNKAGIFPVIYIPIDHENTTQLKKLLKIMELLRSKEGCPWDREQDHQSLKKYLIEEAYEVLERIEQEDIKGLVEELGDLLLQVVFHAQIGREESNFTIYDVISQIVNKLIRRHPHVFTDLKVSNSSEVMKNWEQIKKEEKGKNLISILDGVPKQFPGLLQAQKIQEKAAKVGFDWTEIKGALFKVEEELAEFKLAIKKDDFSNCQEEFGDLIFSLVNVARFLNIDAEVSLQKTVIKFKKRFKYIEEQVSESNSKFAELSLKELDELWTEAKEKLE